MLVLVGHHSLAVRWQQGIRNHQVPILGWFMLFIILAAVPPVQARIATTVWRALPRLVRYSSRRLTGRHATRHVSAQLQNSNYQTRRSWRKTRHKTESTAHEPFLIRPPEFDRSPMLPPEASAIQQSFISGYAGNYSPLSLVRSGAFIYQPMRGGVYPRRDTVKYIVLHSTETGSPADAQRVIHSWGSNGSLAHPGAQFLVDRDGTIYNTVTPDLATVHINTHKTLPGYSNDNSIGIEIVHTSGQTYTPMQVANVVRLVTYLQNHYRISDDRVVTHKYVQPSDRRDPVDFDLSGFEQTKVAFMERALGAHSPPPAPPPILKAQNEMPPTAPSRM